MNKRQKKKAAIKILKEIGLLVLSQDNRFTREPMFIVEKESETGPLVEGYGHDAGWKWYDDCDEVHDEHLIKRLEQRIEAGADRDDDYGIYRCLLIGKEWKFVTACFTEQGCKDYISANGHNVGKTRIYADGSFRNHEYQEARNALMTLAES